MGSFNEGDLVEELGHDLVGLRRVAEVDVHVLQILLELFSLGLDVLSEPPAERGLTRAHLAVDVDPDAHPAFLVKDWIEVPLKLL